METIAWTSLPKWVRFAFETDERSEVHRHSDAQGREVWNASLMLHLDYGDHRRSFAACLNSLDLYVLLVSTLSGKNIQAFTALGMGVGWKFQSRRRRQDIRQSEARN